MKTAVTFVLNLNRKIGSGRYLSCCGVLAGIVLSCASQVQALDSYSYVRLEVVVPGTECGCRPSQFGYRSDATDGHDAYPVDQLLGARQENEGFAAIYYENGPDWSGDTGWYQRDSRSLPASGESKTWTFYVWVADTYPEDQMAIATDGRFIRIGSFKLRLDAVPAGVTGAPTVGTEWDFPTDKSLSISLPPYKTDDGKTGYVFTLTMTNDGSSNPPCCPFAAPVLLVLAAGGWMLVRPRR
jgi:hypothetical protein